MYYFEYNLVIENHSISLKDRRTPHTNVKYSFIENRIKYLRSIYFQRYIFIDYPGETEN
jgi:hypothetical protein